jgi:tRNA threonylcarbamoyladenosine biosynthesis protein TsaE
VSARRAAATAGPTKPAWISRSESDTERLGALLAEALEPGDVIVLQGALGAGKTRLVAGLARGLGHPGQVKSPTFTLLHEYAGRATLYHADLYRIGTEDAQGLGLDEAAERGILVVEWGEKLPPALLRSALVVEIAIRAGDERALVATATPGTRGAALLLRSGAAVRALGGGA